MKWRNLKKKEREINRNGKNLLGLLDRRWEITNGNKNEEGLKEIMRRMEILKNERFEAE